MRVLDSGEFGGRVRDNWHFPYARENGEFMIILGLILLIIGWLAGISILTTIGVILLVIGVILFILGRMGTAVGGRTNWY
jgi:hypothetical protein